MAMVAPVTATAQETPAPPQVSRANLANAATFTVTSVLAPKGGSKTTQTFRVEIKGNKARLDYSDPATGDVQYLANEKGVFFVIPANRTAVKQNIKGGVEQALQVAFAQANEQLKTAKKIGQTTVNGMPADIFKDADSGTTIYVGKKQGFRLPLKTLISNEGGSRTITVSNIKINPKITEARFALPKGMQIVDGGNRPVGATGPR
jgi:outer membrane lipoprotein-sorting protein